MQRPAPSGAAPLLGVALLAGPQALLIVAGRHGIGGWTPLLYSLMPLLLGVPAGAWTPAMAAAPACVLVLLNGSVPLTPAKLGWAICVFVAVLMQAGALRFLFNRCREAAVRPLLAAACAYAAVGLELAGTFLDRSPRLTLSSEGWAAAALAGLLGTALPYAGLFTLLMRGPFTPAQVAVGQWLQLLFTVGESAALVRARVPASVLLAAAALLACAWSVLWQKNDDQDSPSRLFQGSP